MGWATVTNIRARITTVLTDANIQSILDDVKEDILNDLGVASLLTVPYKVAKAHKYRALAATLQIMKTNGELPESNRAGDIQQINKIDKDITLYNTLADMAMKEYRLGASSSTTAPYVISHVMYRDCPDADDADTQGTVGR